MKLTIIPKWMLLAGAAMILVTGALAGCDDDVGGTDGGDTESPVSVTSIIVNPKSPAPGDTIQLTAVVVSETPNVGVFPNISWSASGGEFLESSQTSVRWIAPGVSTLVTVSVTASTSISNNSKSATLFVGNPDVVVAREAGQPFLTGTTKDDFFYYRTSDPGEGYEFYHYSGGVSTDAAAGGLGENLVISRSLTSAAFQRDVPPSGNVIEPIHVYYSDLVAGTEFQVTTDNGFPLSNRRHQFFNPALSGDGTLLAYQGLRTGETAATPDSMDIFVYDPATMETVIVTDTHTGRHMNHLPTFSTDGQWLLFISNRAPANRPAQWEYYGVRVSGTAVDTAMAQTVQITNTNSQVVTVSNNVVNPPAKSWNPVDPILALVSTNFSLLQITFGPQGGTTATTPLIRRPRELVWSPDGSTLAYTDFTAAYTVPAGGTGATLVHKAADGDVLNDIAWSPDQTMLVYRITRGASSWFELKPIGDVSATPVVLTSAESAGSAGSYRRAMSLSPIWLAGDELLLVQFHGDTPGIDVLDISAAVE